MSRFWDILGILVFFCLHIPLLLQTIKEYEVSAFRTEAVEMQVDYGEEKSFVFIDLGTRSAFVTLVTAETRCESARPKLLLIILLVGFVIGILTNAELFYGAFRCGCCCSIDDPALGEETDALNYNSTDKSEEGTVEHLDTSHNDSPLTDSKPINWTAISPHYATKEKQHPTSAPMWEDFGTLPFDGEEDPDV